MPKVQRLPLTDQVTEAIVELIDEEGLRDGATLPPTGELAARFGVSVPVVRESIAGLATIGLVKRQQGRESVVSTPDASHLTRLLSWRIANAEVSDEEIQQFREVVEVGNARLAAANRSDGSLDQIEQALQALRSVDSPESLHDADVAFHSAVAHAAGNDLFTLTLDALEPLLRRIRQRVWNGWVAEGGDLESIIGAHAAILEAIRDGDGEAASAAMTAHLSQARQGLESPLDSDGTAPFVRS
ncbi:FadR/GntR family transcriptional regulator [Schumannella luteola]|uniref:GntR family transcriptional repressor for pyruvate dehydrogenase complex n=1 Tax=Schumannella luteola TaxID=472059 RepID=A0A852Y943_9MICO|nr:FadR/GntR family transcriptional regulator [Schumannella luteola]NYG98382.1 GntR family transcriptional repressor for pyruvate dehydrogenase complex [Schumannella luteola]TPX05798.1 FadR family transcriptional regulator [Schumannella luteola]